MFDEYAANEQVYQECARPLVDSLMEGYNSTCFCYGMTGAGKTFLPLSIFSISDLLFFPSSIFRYTMVGQVNEDGSINRDVSGIFTLAVDDVFQRIAVAFVSSGSRFLPTELCSLLFSRRIKTQHIEFVSAFWRSITRKSKIFLVQMVCADLLSIFCAMLTLTHAYSHTVAASAASQGDRSVMSTGPSGTGSGGNASGSGGVIGPNGLPATSAAASQSLELQEDPVRGMVVQDLTEYEAHSVDDIHEILVYGNRSSLYRMASFVVFSSLSCVSQSPHHGCHWGQHSILSLARNLPDHTRVEITST